MIDALITTLTDDLVMSFSSFMSVMVKSVNWPVTLDKQPILETENPTLEWLVSIRYCFAESACWAAMALNNKTVARVAFSMSSPFLLSPDLLTRWVRQRRRGFTRRICYGRGSEMPSAGQNC